MSSLPLVLGLLLATIVASTASAGMPWGVGLKCPSAISLHTAVFSGVTVEMTLPHTGPARVVLRESLSTYEFRRTRIGLVVGAGAAAAFLPKTAAWGSCALFGIEMAMGDLCTCLLADVTILLPWSPNVGGVGTVVEVGFRWQFP
ncbi:hypothetical protein JW848_10780 [Candidatus Bipolaricaulota bacterium]|nr:hypothetical protein [Candidatus Bipolaricaulota bacterium]